MYIYNLEERVSPMEFRQDNFSYPWGNKLNSGLGALFVNFEFNFPDDSGRRDYFEISYRGFLPGAFRDNYDRINSHHRVIEEKLSEIKTRFSDASYSYTRDAGGLLVAVDISAPRPEQYEDIVSEVFNLFSEGVGIPVTDKIGPCIKHYNSDGDVLERQVEVI